MRTTWRALVILLNLSGSSLSGEIPEALQNILAGNRNFFTSDYLADSFAKWQKQTRYAPVDVDSQFFNGSYSEIWLRGIEREGNSMPLLACLMTREPAPKLVDIRRVYFHNRAGFTVDEQAVMDFIEKLIWLSEIHDQTLLYDHLYPEFISAEYEMKRDKKAIITALLRQYPGALPLKSANWDKQGPLFQIHLQFGNNLAGMEITLDIEKYLTVRAFEMHDQVEMVRMLLDSLISWTSAQEVGAGKSMHINLPSFHEAVDTLLRPVADLYHISKAFRSESLAMLQITPPSIDSLESASLKFSVQGYKSLGGDMVLSSSPMLQPAETNSAAFDTLTQLADRMRYRYGSLGLPAMFWLKEENTEIPFKLRIHGHSIDSIAVDNLSTADKILRGLTSGKQIFFFLQECRTTHGGVHLCGAGIWKDPHLYRHHLARITEKFSFKGDRPLLISIMIDLYPYIRTDYVKPATL